MSDDPFGENCVSSSTSLDDDMTVLDDELPELGGSASPLSSIEEAGSLNLILEVETSSEEEEDEEEDPEDHHQNGPTRLTEQMLDRLEEELERTKFVPTRPCKPEVAQRGWMECVFCGTFLAVPGEKSVFANSRPGDVILDHVRNTFFGYRPYACRACRPEIRFGTEWSLGIHARVKHKDRQDVFTHSQQDEYLEELSKLFAQAAMLHDKEKRLQGEPSSTTGTPRTEQMIRELLEVPGFSEDDLDQPLPPENSSGADSSSNNSWGEQDLEVIDISTSSDEGTVEEILDDSSDDGFAELVVGSPFHIGRSSSLANQTGEEDAEVVSSSLKEEVSSGGEHIRNSAAPTTAEADPVQIEVPMEVVEVPIASQKELNPDSEFQSEMCQLCTKMDKGNITIFQDFVTKHNHAKIHAKHFETPDTAEIFQLCFQHGLELKTELPH